MSLRAAAVFRGEFPSRAPVERRRRRRRPTSGSTRCPTISPRPDFPNPDFEKLWPADLHVIGKDITRFHALIWPAMLMAAGLAVPKRIWVHGFVLVGGTRVSKSAGGNLDLRDAIGRFGADASGISCCAKFRSTATAISPGSGSRSATTPISPTRLEISPAARSRWSSAIAAASFRRVQRNEVDDADKADLEAYHSSFGPKGFLLHDALRAVWQTVSRANEYVDKQAPWKLAKDPAEPRGAGEHARDCGEAAGATGGVSVAVHARENRRSSGNHSALPGSPGEMRFSELERLDPTGWKVEKGPSLFPKADAVEYKRAATQGGPLNSVRVEARSSDC